MKSCAHLLDEFQLLLSEGVNGAIQRERTEFDRLAGPHGQSIVLFGARKLGRRTLRGLRSAGIEPLAFSDNSPDLWGTWIDGVKVYSPPEAVRQFGNSAAFVITIWGPGSKGSMAERQNKSRTESRLDHPTFDKRNQSGICDPIASARTTN